MRVWNTTPLTGVASVIDLYGKSIRPGLSAVLDDLWVQQDSRPLDRARAARKVWVGEALPTGYTQEVQQKMAIVINRTARPKKLAFSASEGSGVVILPPHGEAEINEKEMPQTARTWYLDQDVLLAVPLSFEEDLPPPVTDVSTADSDGQALADPEKDTFSFGGRPMKKKRGK